MKNILNWELFTEAYNKPRTGGKRWSVKYKKKINCNNPKGFSQKQYCKRKRRGGHYKTESVNNDLIEQNLNDIFLEVSDIGDWFAHVEVYSTRGKLTGKDYEVYISFGDYEPYLHRGEEGLEDYGYQQKEIPEDFIDCIKRSIEFMDSEGYSHELLFSTEYSSDPGEDVYSNIEVDDLYDDMIMSENEAIRVRFSKD
jgi:hypothetical protein